MNCKNFIKILLASAVIVNSTGCATTYIKNLEGIVKEDHRIVRAEHQKVQKQEKVPFQHIDTHLNISEKRKINLELYLSEQPFTNIILLPTIGEPASSLNEFSSEMASFGHNLYVLDIEGFGESTGERGKIEFDKIHQDISKTIEYIKTQNNKKIVLAGTSIGSEYTLSYLCDGECKKEIDAAVLHTLYAPYLDASGANYKAGIAKNRITGSLISLFAGKDLDILNRLGGENFYNDGKQINQILDDENYVNRINTKCYLRFLRYKPENSLSSYKGDLLFIVSKDDKMISFERSMNIYTYLKSQNPNTALYIPQGKDRNNEVPHMAFDTNYKEISEQINLFLRNKLNSK